MFDGTLGVYPHKKVHIYIDPNAKPVHSRPYPVPQIYPKTFKNELNHLVRLGVLAVQQESQWVLPSFIIPKKDGRVCWISNLRQLNKVIRHKQYPLPIIADILRKHSGYKFFTKLDISMQYYMFELDKESQDFCTIIPFGKYKYLRLTMGLKYFPDIAQAAMENVLSDIKDADVHIDDIGAFSRLGSPCQFVSGYTSDRRSESLSLNIDQICVCEYVSESIPLQIMLGVYLVLCKSVDSLVILENFNISYYPTTVPIFYVLITYSRQHDILIPTYIGMSSLYQVLNYLCS